jgi:hypothetical protein
MALTQQQQDRLQEIRNQANQVEHDAAVALFVKILAIASGAAVSTTGPGAFASGVTDIAAVQSAEADVKAKMAELVRLRQEQKEILDSANEDTKDAIFFSFTTPDVELTISPDSDSPTVITIPTVTIDSGTNEDAGQVTIPEVPIQVDSGDESNVITIPEITITGSLDGDGQPVTGDDGSVAVDGSEGIVIGGGSGNPGLGLVTEGGESVGLDGSEGVVIGSPRGPGLETGAGEEEGDG